MQRNSPLLCGLFIDDPVFARFCKGSGEVNGAKTTLPSDWLQTLSLEEDTFVSVHRPLSKPDNFVQIHNSNFFLIHFDIVIWKKYTEQ